MREFASETERQIIGVVGDTRDGGLNRDPGPAMYIPQAQVPDRGERAEREHRADGVGGADQRRAVSLSNAIQEQIRQASGLPGHQRADDGRSRLAIDVAAALQHVADVGVRRVRAAPRGDRDLRADGVLGGAADAGDRHPPRARRERAAGARTWWSARGCGSRWSASCIGLASAFGLARLVQTMLYGVTTRDPLVFAGVPLVLTAVAFLAVYLPARRASRSIR